MRRSIDPKIQRVALRKLRQVGSAEFLENLRITPGIRLEALKGDSAGLHSIRINESVHGKQGIAADTALRLTKYFGTSADFWCIYALTEGSFQ